jgi:ParB/RepB/Spo0J family partition protein
MAYQESGVGHEIVEIAVARIGERYGQLRIVVPNADRAMVRSMEKYGQLTPVVVNMVEQNSYELLDGFKRLRASRSLGRQSLKARTMNLGVRAGKAAIMQLNWVGKSISTMEEAMVVHSLYHEDGLTQVEIATLLGRHKSWVCRRISLIERLSGEVQDNIRLGLLSVSIGTELARLRRSNQERVLQAIRKHHLTWRETRKLVATLLSQPDWNYEPILRSPWELFPVGWQPVVRAGEKPAGKLSEPACVLRQKLLSMEKACLAVTVSVTEQDNDAMVSLAWQVIETAKLTIKRLGQTFPLTRQNENPF